MDFLGKTSTNSSLPSTAEALIRSYAASFDVSRAPVTITERSGIICYVNPPFTQLTGYTAADVLGKTPRILKSGKHDRFFYYNLWAHLQQGHVWQGKIVNRKKDGSLYVDEQVITPVKQGDGDIGCFIAVRNDITAQENEQSESLMGKEEATFPGQVDQLAESARSPKELLEGALKLFLSMHEFKKDSSGVAFEICHGAGVLNLVATRGEFSAQFLRDEATIPIGACLCGKAAVEGRVLVCSNCYKGTRHEHRWLGMRVHGHYTVPIRTPEQILAVINVYTDVDVNPSDRRVAFLASLGFRLGAHLDRLLKSSPQ